MRRLKQSFKSSDKLFLLIGMDAFAEIAKWHQAEALFRECEFIVASRPGYSLADVANALPESLRPRPEVTKPFHKQAATGDLVLPGATIHLMGDLHQPASATAIRAGCGGGEAAGAVCRSGRGGVHQEDGAVPIERRVLWLAGNLSRYRLKGLHCALRARSRRCIRGYICSRLQWITPNLGSGRARPAITSQGESAWLRITMSPRPSGGTKSGKRKDPSAATMAKLRQTRRGRGEDDPASSAHRSEPTGKLSYNE